MWLQILEVFLYNIKFMSEIVKFGTLVIIYFDFNTQKLLKNIAKSWLVDIPFPSHAPPTSKHWENLGEKHNYRNLS